MGALTYLVWVFVAGRLIIGLAPIFAMGLTARVLGIQPQHDTPMMRLMARFWGVREAALGVLVVMVMEDRALLFKVALFSALVDGADALLIAAIPLARRQGIDRTAWISGGFALGATFAWLVLAYLLRPA